MSWWERKTPPPPPPPPRRPAGEARILKLRDKEERQAVAVENLRQQQAQTYKVAVEVAAEKHMVKAAQRFRTAAEQRAHEEALAVRKLRLAAQLEEEEEALRQELALLAETPEQRRASLEQRARHLNAKREAERMQFVEEQLSRQFRESCDPVRTIESKRRGTSVVAQRQQQMAEKQMAKQQERAQDEIYEQMLQAEHARMEQRYLEDLKHRRELDEAAVRVLNEQLIDIERRQQAATAQNRVESAALKSQWAQDDSEAQRIAEEIKRRNRRIGDDMLKYNQVTKAQREETERLAREEDKRLVEAALEAERQDQAREAQHRAEQQAETRRYREHLRMMMQKEEADEAERDAKIQAEADRAWQKRVDQWAREEQARQRLMDQVRTTREEQLALKEQRRQQDAEAQRLERLRYENDAQQSQQEDRQRRQNTRMVEEDNAADLMAQMRALELRKRLQAEDAKQSFENARSAEQEYQELVQHTLQKEPERQYFGRKKAQWYN
eukprot:jgi/Chlat1/4091/Chrsp26S04142